MNNIRGPHMNVIYTCKRETMQDKEVLFKKQIFLVVTKKIKMKKCGMGLAKAYVMT